MNVLKTRKLSLLITMVISALILVSGCKNHGPIVQEVKLNSIRVTLLSDSGSPENPILIGADGISVKLKVEGINTKGEVVPDYSARLFFKHPQAHLGLEGFVEEDIVNGDEIEFTLNRALGEIRILVEDKETLVVGSSDILYFPMPTLTTVQRPLGDHGLSPWRDTFMHVGLGDLIVTSVEGDGFYVTDMAATEYNHIYVYTHGNPYADRGDILHYVSGTLSEYYGLTELSFPDYDIKCNHHPLPEPIALTATMLSDNTYMEKLECAIVSVTGLEVYDVDEAQLMEYSQWQGKADDGARITMITKKALPGFNPLDYEGDSKNKFDKVVGILRYHSAPKWTLVPRDECDVWGIVERPERCDEPQLESNCK